MHYKLPLLFEPQPEGGFTVTSPLIPELVTEGDTLERALENVRDAFQAVIETYQENGKELLPSLLISDPTAPVRVETIVVVPPQKRPAESGNDTHAVVRGILCDAEGPIPTFPPRAFDEHGRLIPLSPEERKARSEAAIRALKAIEERPDTDPPGSDETFMRAMDENRPPGHKLFEGMY